MRQNIINMFIKETYDLNWLLPSFLLSLCDVVSTCGSKFSSLKMVFNLIQYLQAVAFVNRGVSKATAYTDRKFNSYLNIRTVGVKR